MCFRGEVTSCIVPCFALPVNHKFCAPAGNTARNHEAPGAENFFRRNNSLLREASLRVLTGEPEMRGFCRNGEFS